MRWRVTIQSLAVGLVAMTALATSGCGVLSSTRTYLPDTEAEAVTVNIDVTDRGFEPADVRIPAGPSIQLLLRNRTTDERHYRVVGLNATQILWLAPKDDMVREEGISEEDHEMHHAKDFVDWRAKSPEGVKPTLTEVHAYAVGKTVDVVHFFALQPGKYQVVDPLHPDVKGTLTVVAR